MTKELNGTADFYLIGEPIELSAEVVEELQEISKKKETAFIKKYLKEALKYNLFTGDKKKMY